MQEIIIFFNFHKNYINAISNKCPGKKLKNSISAWSAYSNFYEMYYLFSNYPKRIRKLVIVTKV